MESAGFDTQFPEPASLRTLIASINVRPKIFNVLTPILCSYLHSAQTHAVSIRKKVALQLGSFAFLAAIFLLLFPRRNPWVDVVLGGFAFFCIAVTARYTQNAVWGASRPPQSQQRLKKCIIFTTWITAPTALVFFLIGGIVAYRAGGWPHVVEHILDWKILLVFVAYIGWAFVQQTLFQFYLLGRLLVLFPKEQFVWPILITGLGFSLLHLPDVWTALVTAIAGPIWTFIYYRYRCLLPVAISHAALGTAFYYGLCNHNLAQEWRTAASTLGLQ